MKAARISLFVLASVLLIIATDQYLFCPVYRFPGFKPFAGDSLYNPYKNISFHNWVRCNFHAHTHCWEGFTNGRGAGADVNKVYASLHYGVHAISNYEEIDTTGCSEKQHINCYEHGYNMNKVHQLVIGASHVCFKDYLLPQTLSNKQCIMNLLDADTSALVVINHPRIRKAYRAADFAKLTGYSCIEVLNPAGNSSALWDAALSRGRPVFIIGDDDVHNVFDSSLAGRMFTMIDAPDICRNNIISSLKMGRGYAIQLDRAMVLRQRRGLPVLLPELTGFSVSGNMLSLHFNKPAKTIFITGKNGKKLKEIFNTDSAVYNIPPYEPYVRETAVFSDGSVLYLNPVFRYRTKLAFRTESIPENRLATYSLRALGILLLVLWFAYIARLTGRYFFKRKTSGLNKCMR